MQKRKKIRRRRNRAEGENKQQKVHVKTRETLIWQMSAVMSDSMMGINTSGTLKEVTQAVRCYSRETQREFVLTVYNISAKKKNQENTVKMSVSQFGPQILVDKHKQNSVSGADIISFGQIQASQLIHFINFLHLSIKQSWNKERFFLLNCLKTEENILKEVNIKLYSS